MSIKTTTERLLAEDAERERAEKIDRARREAVRLIAPITLAVADGRWVDATRGYDLLPFRHVDFENGVTVRSMFYTVMRNRLGADGVAEMYGQFDATRAVLDAEYRKVRARQIAEAQIGAAS